MDLESNSDIPIFYPVANPFTRLAKTIQAHITNSDQILFKGGHQERPHWQQRPLSKST